MKGRAVSGGAIDVALSRESDDMRVHVAVTVG